MLKELIIDDYGASLHKKSERLVLKKNGEVMSEHAIKELDDLVISHKCGMISIGLIEELIQNGTQIHLVDFRHEPFVTLYTPAHHGSIKTRREQLAAYHDQRGVEFSRQILKAKLLNQLNLIKYFVKNRKEKRYESLLSEDLKAIKRYLAKLVEVNGEMIEEVRQDFLTLEAHAAKNYWKCIKLMINEKVDFKGRDHQSTDPINLMLNYGYGILGSRMSGAIIRSGLEPFGGFLHADRSGKPSLRFDLMEVFRQPVVDRVVFSLINRGFVPQLEEREDGSIFIDHKTREKLRANLNKRLDAEEYYQGKTYRLKTIIQLQARALAAFFREGKTYKGYIARW